MRKVIMGIALCVIGATVIGGTMALADDSPTPSAPVSTSSVISDPPVASGDDDGTPDQGSGDFTTEQGSGGTDDGTPDQGSGDFTTEQGEDDSRHDGDQDESGDDDSGHGADDEGGNDDSGHGGGDDS
jgi:hypothetical protein